jgi:Sugar-transfer associated ATP-grasp
MRLNDWLTRTLGVRIVRARHLEALGLMKSRQAMKRFRDEALAAVRCMERFNGKKLTPALKAKADAYARDVLSDADHAPWLYVFATMQGEFREGWMPDDFYHMVVVPKIANGLAHVTNIKSLTGILLETDALPDLAYHVGGVYYDRDRSIISLARVKEIVAPYGHAFVKQDGRGAGQAIRKLAPAELTAEALAEDCVLQRPIQSHPDLEEIFPGAVATLRITTARAPNGEISRRGAYLRLGRKGTDWVMSLNSMEVAVVDEEGALDSLGYDEHWRAWSAHPDTGVGFAGRRVPEFRRAAALCLKLHAKAPHMPVVGWDVAVNRDNGIELIEWNGGHCDIKFCEAHSGPHFRDMGWERFATKVGH